MDLSESLGIGFELDFGVALVTPPLATFSVYSSTLRVVPGAVVGTSFGDTLEPMPRAEVLLEDTTP